MTLEILPFCFEAFDLSYIFEYIYIFHTHAQSLGLLCVVEDVRHLSKQQCLNFLKVNRP